MAVELWPVFQMFEEDMGVGGLDPEMDGPSQSIRIGRGRLGFELTPVSWGSLDCDQSVLGEL